VIKDVPSFALIVGVPGRRIGWLGKLVLHLESIGEGKFMYPKCGCFYHSTE
jgi:hypothetical protein